VHCSGTYKGMRVSESKLKLLGHYSRKFATGYLTTLRRNAGQISCPIDLSFLYHMVSPPLLVTFYQIISIYRIAPSIGAQIFEQFALLNWQLHIKLSVGIGVQ
jgi:hypothetical protein